MVTLDWIQVKAFALNHMDILQREGKYPVAVKVSPILGVEVSGIVESVGKDGKCYLTKLTDAM